MEIEKPNVQMLLTEKNLELKQRLELQNNFSKERHSEKVDLVLLRQKYAIELINVRDKIALKRHNERIQILDKKFTIN